MPKLRRIRRPPVQSETRLGGTARARRGSPVPVAGGLLSGRSTGGSWRGALIRARRLTRCRPVCCRTGPAPGAVEAATHVGRPAQDVLPLDGRGVRGLVALLVLPVAAPDPHQCVPV